MFPEPDTGVFSPENEIVDAQLDHDYLRVTLADRRIVSVPVDWLFWLEGMSEAQRQNFEVLETAINWPEPDEGISIEPILLGQHPHTPVYVTIAEMAEMHDISEMTVRRAIERGALEGAVKVGDNKHRSEWRIPRAAAVQYEPRRRGRPSMKKDE